MQDNLIENVLMENLGGNENLSISMRDGTVIEGRVSRFDGYVIVLAGEPQTIVYRHSVLKLGKPGAMEAAKLPPRSEAGNTRQGPAPQSPDRDAHARKPVSTKPADRPARQPKRKPPRKQDDRRPSPGTEPQELDNPLAEQMKKWLDSQKGDK